MAGRITEAETNSLFEKNTVEDVRKIELKTRAGIESKKRELRELVGERYRDFIDAADTITGMKGSANSIDETVVSLQGLCQSLKEVHLVKGAVPQSSAASQHTSNAAVYGIGCQIKLLLNVPEKIWSCIDRREYLQASRLFLLARHVHTTLQYDSRTSARVAAWFPVAARQWVAISHFRASILEGCRKLLRDPQATDDSVSQALCSLCLLEDRTQRQAFQEFLLARSQASSWGEAGSWSGGAKDHALASSRLLLSTVCQLHSVFSGEGPDTQGLLAKALQEVVSEGVAAAVSLEEISGQFSKYIPKSVLDFKPTLKVEATNLQKEYLQASSKKWMEVCLKNVRRSLGSLLEYVTSAKALASIRHALWEELSAEPRIKSWSRVSLSILGMTFDLWSDLFSAMFEERIKAIFSSSCDSIAQQAIALLDECPPKLHGSAKSAETLSLGDFVWEGCAKGPASGEHSSAVSSNEDVCLNASWLSAGSKTFTDGGQLMMRAHGYLPTVQILAATFDRHLETLYVDAQEYIGEPNGALPASSQPFDQHSGDNRLRQALQATCFQCLNRLCDSVKQRMEQIKPDILGGSGQASQPYTDRLLIHGRFVWSLCQLSPNLEKLISQHGEMEQRMITSVSSGRLLPRRQNAVWLQCLDTLRDTAEMAYSVWAESVVNEYAYNLEEAFRNQTVKTLVRDITRWDELEIQEESADGKAVHSKIRVPMQASELLLSSLFKLCSEMNRASAHILPKPILHNLIYRIMDETTRTYESAMQTTADTSGKGSCLPLTQARALQYSFDLSFMAGLLDWKASDTDKSLESRVQGTLEGLHSRVDPFDLDVFSPHMRRHVSRLCQRSVVLFGAVAARDLTSLSSSLRPSQTGHQETPNVLPLYSSSHLRFSTLPVTHRAAPPLSARAHPPGLSSAGQQAAMRRGRSSQPVMTHSATEPAMTSSFYDKLGSMWMGIGGGGGGK